QILPAAGCGLRGVGQMRLGLQVAEKARLPRGTLAMRSLWAKRPSKAAYCAISEKLPNSVAAKDLLKSVTRATRLPSLRLYSWSSCGGCRIAFSGCGLFVTVLAILSH